MTVAKATQYLYYGSHPIFATSWPDGMEREADPGWRYDILSRLGITHILNLGEAPENPEHARRFETYHIFLPDNLAPRGDFYWAEVTAFYAEALKAGGKLFVHCDGGRSRSVATCVVLLLSQGMSEHDARSAVERWGNDYVHDGQEWLEV